MLGFYEVPLYTDTTYSDKFTNIYIPIVSREEADNTHTFTYTTISDLEVLSYYGGRSKWGNDFKGMIYNSDVGMWDGGSSASATLNSRLPKNPTMKAALAGANRSHISNLLVPGAYAEGQLTNKFNFFRLAFLALDENAPITLYLKNGKYLTVTKVEDTQYLKGKISLHRENGSEISAWNVILGYQTPTTSPSGAYFNNASNLISTTTMRGLCETYNCDQADSFAFLCWHLYDDYTGLTAQELYPYYVRVGMWRVHSGSPSSWKNNYGLGTWITGCTMGSFSASISFYEFFFTWLGVRSLNSIPDDLSNLGGIYKEDTEDADNTYPGGGEDKNTYPEDGESGKGTFDNTNDEVDFPSIPLWDATSTGFISMWNPTITEITALYGFLWDSDISTTLKKLFLEPMDAIISLAFFPVDPINFPEKRNVTIGHVDTDIQMYAVQKQFVDFDFGTLKIDEYYGAAWDYSPYTQASIYLPYIGTQALDIDDVMNGTLHLKYRVDLLSGMCAAMLRVDRSRDGLQAVIYTWQGNCAMQVPITAGSARDFLNSIIQLGAMAGVSLAQPLAGAIDASMHKGEENYQSPIMGNNWINPTIATFSALNVIGQKVRVQRGGRVDANAGVMSPQEAYIILNRPVSAIPKGWNEYAGYPSLKVKTLSTQKGYTEIAYIKLNGLEATSDEIMELDGMLKGGVIL